VIVIALHTLKLHRVRIKLQRLQSDSVNPWGGQGAGVKQSVYHLLWCIYQQIASLHRLTSPIARDDGSL